MILYRRHIADSYYVFQHRVTQETILYKDERLREAQSWIARVQEMDALQSTTLQAELRERTEQYNQLWLGCQRQVDSFLGFFHGTFRVRSLLILSLYTRSCISFCICTLCWCVIVHKHGFLLASNVSYSFNYSSLHFMEKH